MYRLRKAVSVKEVLSSAGAAFLRGRSDVLRRFALVIPRRVQWCNYARVRARSRILSAPSRVKIVRVSLSQKERRRKPQPLAKALARRPLKGSSFAIFHYNEPPPPSRAREALLPGPTQPIRLPHFPSSRLQTSRRRLRLEKRKRESSDKTIGQAQRSDEDSMLLRRRKLVNNAVTGIHFLSQ